MSEAGDSARRTRRIAIPLLALTLLGLALTLPRLGSSGLWDPWEPKYAQTAREMGERGDWIVPYFREHPRLNKAPMTYWLIGASQSLLGVTELAARLPSALLGVIGPLALMLAFAARGRELEGFLAGAALLTGPQWTLIGRFATPDMPLASCFAIALACAIALPGATTRRHRRGLFLILLLAIAAAGLTDWPRGLLLPLWSVVGWAAIAVPLAGVPVLAAVGALHYVAQRIYNIPLNLVSIAATALAAPVFLKIRGSIGLRASLIGAAVVVLLVVPWLVAVHWLEPDDVSLLRYKYAFNLGETEGRFTKSLVYVLNIVSIGALPWSAAALVGLIVGVGRRKDDVAVLSAGAFIGCFLFFTLAEAKMGHFYGAMQPAVASLAAVGLVSMLRRRDWTAFVAGAALVGVWLVIRDEPARILETATVKRSLFGLDLLVPATVATLAWAAALIAAGLWRRERWAIAGVLPAALFAGALGIWLLPTLEPKKSLKPTWARYLETRSEGEPIGSMGSVKDGYIYYSNNGIARLKRQSQISEFLAGPGAKFVILSKKDYRRLGLDKGVAGGRWERLEESHPTHLLVRFTPGR